MINKIIDAICISINSEFGDDYKIYTEDVEQSLKEHCFLITCFSTSNDLSCGKKYFKQNKFLIQYFPSPSEGNIERNITTERLFDCLELITVDDDKLRGTKMNSEIIDRILKISVNYDMFVYKVEEETPMGELEQTTTDVQG